MPRVFSAALEVDTRYKHNTHAAGSLQDKISYLRRSLRYAVRGFTQLNNDVAPSVANGDIMIFAAPEYYFGKSQFDAHASVFAYSLHEAAQIEAGCIRISTRHPDVVIVPGTILYKMNAGRSTRTDIAAELTQGRQNFTHPNQRRQISKVHAQIKPRGHGLKSLIHGGPGRPIGYNQARVYFNGARIYTLNKIDNALEFAHEPGGSPILIPGTQTGAFDYPANTQYKIGLEICADHGRLESANERVDILILVAASIPLANSGLPVLTHGLAIHANAASFERSPSGMRRIKAPDNAGFVFDVKATTAELLQAVTVHAVRCQVETLA